jgi:hypothetical protein
MLRRVALVKSDVSAELRASIIRVTRIGAPILVTMMVEALGSAQTLHITVYRGSHRGNSVVQNGEFPNLKGGGGLEEEQQRVELTPNSQVSEARMSTEALENIDA